MTALNRVHDWLPIFKIPSSRRELCQLDRPALVFEEELFKKWRSGIY